MKKRTISIALIVLATLVGCESDHPMIPTDQILEGSIIGKWAGSGYTINFNSDYSFSDSSLTVMDIDSTQIISDTVMRVGKYIIKDGILYLYDVHFTYVGIIATGTSSFSTQYEISISDNKLIRKRFDVFDLNGTSNNQLFGSWQRERWYCNYSIDDSVVYSNGKREEYFTFWQDSTKCLYQVKYLTGAVSPREYSYKVSFTYQNSKLSLSGVGYTNLDVQFKQNKMFWYRSAHESELSRM